jgi:dienelactone hydrolase
MAFVTGIFLSCRSALAAGILRRLLVATGCLFSLGLAAPLSAADNSYGGFGPEGPRMREQLWILPSGEPGRVLRATLFRPEADPTRPDAKFPLVVINHGTDEATRLAVSMPVYYWLSRWFVERGYAVLLPQRRGHGATGGGLSEAVGTCVRPDHFDAGNVAADDIAATLKFMSGQPFIQHNDTVIAGISTGGWASLAIAARNLPQVQAIVNFAGGRGGHAYGQANAICGESDLLAAARLYGRTAHEPTIWFYSRNDSYFGPGFAQKLARSWGDVGGDVEEHILPAYGSDGHTIADDRAGWELWGPSLDRFLTRVRGRQLNVAAEHSAPASPIETSSIAGTNGATR